MSVPTHFHHPRSESQWILFFLTRLKKKEKKELTLNLHRNECFS